MTDQGGAHGLLYRAAWDHGSVFEESKMPGNVVRARSLAAAAVLLTAAAASLAPTVLATEYTYPCDAKRTTHDTISKDVTATVYYIKGVAGDAFVRNLMPCTTTGPTFGSGWDFPAVIPATLQDQNAITNNIIQIAYGRCGASGPCGNIPNDGRMYPVYTGSDTSGGDVTLATWYHSGAPLVLNNRYRMRVLFITGASCPPHATECWQYCIRNLTTGESYVCMTMLKHWTPDGGNFAWWGAETNDLQSQMAVKASDPDITMDYMQYLTTVAGAQWTVRTGVTACGLPDGNPAWYKCTTTTTVYSYDTLNAWTNLH